MTGVTNPATVFERVYCVNLDRRPDRWRRFCENLPADWPFPPPVRVSGVDGKRVRHPEYWTSGGGAWGCYLSHLRTIETCLNEGVRSVLLLEDDAMFPAGFSGLACEWLNKVPADWQMLYLGGQHLFAGQHPPIEVSPRVYQPYNVNRTHAFALQGDMLQIVYHHLLRRDWHRRNHIDHHLGRLHQQRKHRIYCPGKWLVGQAGGKSNISGREPPDRFWRPAAEIASQAATSLPLAKFVAILGLHSSGSSALCQALYHCGLWFGEPQDLQGYWGRNNPVRGGEHKQLAKILETAMPLQDSVARKPGRWLRKQLQGFISARQSEAEGNGAIAAGKYPQLCIAGPQLRKLLGHGLRVVICDRPVEESIASLIRRTNSTGPAADVLTAHQRALANARDALAIAIPHRIIRIDYAALLADPAGQIQRVCSWLGLAPTPAQLLAAAAEINPDKRHIAKPAA